VVGLLFGGDVNIAGRADPATAFAGLGGVLGGGDVRFVNLEGPLCGSAGAGVDIPHKPNWTHPEPEMVDGLTAAGIDVVSCANNVTFPPTAAMTSLAVLDQAGIAHCGAGQDLAAAHAPAVVDTGGVRVGFLGYTSICWPFGHAATATDPGVAAARAHTSYQPDYRALEVPGRPPKVLTTPLAGDLERLIADIHTARDQAEIVVVSVHWGVAGDTLADYQITLARAAIDAGADVVVGHGPHTVQAVELYRGAPILYSLGNLVFDWPVMRGRHRDGLLARLTTGHGPDHRPVSVDLYPVRRDEDNQTHLLTGPAAGALIGHVAALSAARDTTITIADGVGILGCTTTAPST